ncbi:MAG: DNA repair exonuclease [Bradyrhizobium sp.]|uniref:metallophosphoesterase family protein n=1 Tax=Bradyrhizobium sp. TaxID=376 RepID=UPI0029AD1BA3|nr:DNA repair exonuclease [Bradyrhizobium sp.]MDX3966821.1 DNA repair exonuclease [Bradyrhizobium sp.]
MGVRFLHTADLQIGKGFGQFPPDVAAALRTERLETLRRIATLARDLAVDAVLVAGDCFDDIAVADETLRRFKVALEPFDGMWVLLPGNHDPAIAESPWSRLKRLPLPANVIVADAPEPIVIGNRMVVLPAPLRRRRDAADLTDWFNTAVTEDGLVRIGLAHGSVREFLPEASEAANPIALDRAECARLDYLALGDWHGRLQVSERTWYSGTPEPDRFRANEPGYVLDVTIEGPGTAPRVEGIPVATYRWIQRSVEIAPGGAEEVRTGLDVPEEELERCVVQLDLEGTVDLATRMEVSEKLDDLSARVLHLKENDAGLVVEPTEDDLDAIDTAGFVRVAMNRLREKLHGPDATTARRALALLYGLHHRGGG